MVDFSDLDDTNLDNYGKTPAKKSKKDRPTFPCQTCAGTGRYRHPRVHQEKDHCFACGGRGFFYTSPFDRQKKRDAAHKRKADAILKVQQTFDAQYPGVIALAREFGKTSEFMRSLVDQYGSGKLLTERQVEAIRKFAEKRDEYRIQRQAERDKLSTEVDLAPIHAMFDHARDAGLKKLQYRAEGLVIKPASAVSANAGALYVKTTNDCYIGKVIGNKFHPNRDATQSHKEALLKIAKDPVDAAKAYGKLTGSCSCCGRTLTDPQSIELGIGPVCAEKWFGFTIPGPTKVEAKRHLEEAAIEINTNYPRALPIAGKYDHLYKEGMTAKEKQAIRAKARKEART